MARRLGLVGLAGVALGLTAEWVGFGWGDPRRWIPDLAVGWTLIGCGLVAWERRPESRTGPLMAATGFTWFVGNFSDVGLAAVAWVAAPLVYLHREPLVQLVLTYPSGRSSSRLAQVAVVVGYAAAVITPIWDSEAATILLAPLLTGVCARDHIRAVGRARRARRAALQATAGLSVVLVGTAAARLLLPAGEVSGPSLLVYEATLCVLAGWLLAGLVLTPWDRAAVTDPVVELGEARTGTLRGALSRALGDPSLEIGYWLADTGAFVDAEGRTLFIPDPGSGRSVTVVEREGRPVAVLVHDPAVLADPGPLEADTLRRSRRSASGQQTRDQIARAEAQLAQTLEELRGLAKGLHPGVLSERGLEGALAALANDFPIPVQVTVAGDRVPSSVAVVAYFVCAEALANVAKHASASGVAVSVTARDDRVRIEIEDDGVGGADPGGGSGLRGLADRVETIGGRCGWKALLGMGRASPPRSRSAARRRGDR
jgi:hypothetical protein